MLIPEMPPEDGWEEKMCQKLSAVKGISSLDTKETVYILSSDRSYFYLLFTLYCIVFVKTVVHGRDGATCYKLLIKIEYTKINFIFFKLG